MRAIVLVLVSMLFSGCYLLEERDELGLVYPSDPATFPEEQPPPAPSYDAGMITPDAALPAPDAGLPAEDAFVPEPDAAPPPDLGPLPEPDAGSDAGSPVDPCAPPTGDGPELWVEIVDLIDPEHIRQRLVAMGLHHVELVRFRFTAGPDEDIAIDEVPAALWIVFRSAAFKNYRLEAGGWESETYAAAPRPEVGGSDTVGLTFYWDGLVIPRGTSVDVSLVADAVDYRDGAESGAEIRAGFSLTCYPWAHGATTGMPVNPLTAVVLESGLNYDASVFGDSVVVYRTVLGIARHSISPSGETSGASQQTVAVYQVTATSPGGYTATLQLLNQDVFSTIWNTSPRTIRVYRDYVTNPDFVSEEESTEIASHTFAVGERFTDTTWTDEDFEDVDISPEGRLIYVTADTSDAATDKVFVVGIDTDDMLSSDGITTDIAECNSLALAGIMFSY